MNKISTILRCQKAHICFFCSSYIDVGETYFKMERGSVQTRLSDGKKYIKPLNDSYPRKCCYTCFPQQKDKFYAESKSKSKNKNS